jgi:hypothetical protein
MDVYFDNERPVVLISAKGKLYRAALNLDAGEVQLGAMTEVEIVFAPTGRMRVIRQKDGKVRWFAVACTAVLNRVGEIDSRKLFESFVTAFDTGDYPVHLRFYHDPRLNMGYADFMAVEGNTLLMSGMFDDSTLAEVTAAALERDVNVWGVSIGYTATAEPERMTVSEGVTIPVYTDGVPRELSVLPESEAAAWYTSIDREAMGMRKEVETALLALFGEDRKKDAQEFISGVDNTNREITEQGLITRGATTPPVTEPPVTTPPAETLPPAEQARELVLDEAAVAAIAAKVPVPAPVDLTPVTESLSVLTKGMEMLIGRVGQLEKTDADKQRQWLADQPARNALNVSYRPRDAHAPAPDVPRTSDDLANESLSKLPARTVRPA